MHSDRGLRRPFTPGIFVNSSGARAVWVISRGTAGASSGRVGGAQRQRAIEAARAAPCGGQKFCSAGEYGAPPGPLSLVAARVSPICQGKRRGPVLWPVHVFSLLRAQCQVPSLMYRGSEFWSLRFGFRLYA